MDKRDLKQELQNVWDSVFIKWRRKKYEIIDSYVFCKQASDSLKDEDNKKYEDVKRLADLYESILKVNDDLSKFQTMGTGIFEFDWIVLQFVEAVKSNTNIYLERKLSNDFTLHKDLEKENNKMCYIVQELIKHANTEKISENITAVPMGDYIEYQVIGIPIFRDYQEKIDVDTAMYIGIGDLAVAQIIFLGDEYKSADKTEYNQGKIFFTDIFDLAVEYAGRWKVKNDRFVMELNLENVDIYRRKHALVSRAADIFYTRANSITVRDKMKKIYCVDVDGNKSDWTKYFLQEAERLEEKQNSDEQI